MIWLDAKGDVMTVNERGTPTGSSLLPFYDGWGRHNDLLIEAIQPLTDEQLQLRAAEHLRPVWLLAAHIIGTRVGWFNLVMGEGDEAFARFEPWDYDGAPVRSAGELVAGLAGTWRQLRECLQRWTPADLEATFPRPNGEAWTRQWVIWHVLEHDISHGGELFLTLGMHGLTTPDL